MLFRFFIKFLDVEVNLISEIFERDLRPRIPVVAILINKNDNFGKFASV